MKKIYEYSDNELIIMARELNEPFILENSLVRVVAKDYFNNDDIVGFLGVTSLILDEMTKRFTATHWKFE